MTRYIKVRLTGLTLHQVFPDSPLTAIGAQVTPGPPLKPVEGKEVLSASLYGTDEATGRGIYLDVEAAVLGDAHNLGDEYVLVFQRIK